MKLIIQALSKYLLGLVIAILILFLPADGFHYWNGWLFIGLLFLPMFIVGIVLLIKNPKLLEKRLNNKEKEKPQKIVLLLSGILFIACFLVAAFDFRYGWSKLPLWIVITSSVIFFIAYLLYLEVMRENVYLSRVIEVQENQKVIDTGLYGIVRHPMYFAASLLFLMIPLVLGSWIAFIIMVFVPLLIVFRIKNEEEVLEKELPGYKEYKQKVKYKILPFLW